MIPEPIGFIGLGRMGGGMARQLLAKGHAVICFDPDPSAVAAVTAAGGNAVASPRAVADQAEIVFACLPTIAICDDVALGPDGIVHGGAVRVYVETSTVGPAEAKRIADALFAARGIRLLDAPISGGPKGAEDGTLTTIVAGDRTAFDKASPFFEAVATHVVYAGKEPGLGQVYKIANNYIVMSSMAAVCEAIAVAVKSGADEAMLLDVLNHSTGRNFVTSYYFPTVIQPRAKISSLKMASKDVRLFAELAGKLGMESAGAEAVLASWEPAAAKGRSMVDWYQEMLDEKAAGAEAASPHSFQAKAGT